MYYKRKKTILYGFTLTELMVGLSIGIVVLTGLMSFYFRSAKIIGQQQAVVKDLNQLQFVANKIVQDIKESNTQAPGTGSTITPDIWAGIPYMGYGRTYANNLSLYQPALNYPKEYPLYPVAYNFPIYQSGKTATYEGWYPRQDPLAEKNDLARESNHLVFYKIKSNNLYRVIYYLVDDPSTASISEPHLKIYNLKRRMQKLKIPINASNIGSISKSLDLIDETDAEVSLILSGVKFIQFTYPSITQKLADSSVSPIDPDYNPNTFDSALKTKLLNIASTESDTQKIPYTQSNLLNELRNVIKIRIATAGPQIGNKRTIAFELNTEVMIRN